MSKILENMNAMQAEAISYGEGPILILAGAGSGKTRVLTHRIAYLIQENSVYPSQILALTFTNKAAKGMKERIISLIGDEASRMWVGTFHSICVRILKVHIEKAGYGTNFVIYDSNDQKDILKECIKELNYDDKIFTPQQASKVISEAKDEMVEPETFIKRYEGDARLSRFGNIYMLYSKKLKTMNALDFDDILMITVKILLENDDVREYYADKFKYVFVDEYQDTNNIQYKLVTILSKKHGNLCVVGDDDQSIYGWRGANYKNIRNFEKEFKGCKVVMLEQNYRSTRKILEAANNVICKNYSRKGKSLWTESKEEGKLCTYIARNEYDEAQFVANQIKYIKKNENREYKDFAIFYRLNSLSRVIEDTMMSAGIPYKLVGGQKFYERKEIKDIIAYLRLIMNPADNLSLKRIINFPKRGFGPTTLGEVESLANSRVESIFDTLSSASSIQGLEKVSAKCEVFIEMIFLLRAKAYDMKVSEFIKEILEVTGLMDVFASSPKEEDKVRVDNLKEFVSVAVEFEKQSEEKDFGSFMSHLSLVADIDSFDDSEGSVVLMTFHSAKGLEFPIVFMIGVEKGTFPMIRSMEKQEDLEEERRLCYVGITRAREQLYITCTKNRTIYGKTITTGVSEYIRDIPDEIKENMNQEKSSQFKKKYSEVEVETFFGPGKVIKSAADIINMGKNIIDTYNEGARVNQKKFGNGVITKVIIEGDDTMLEIDFDKAGKKRLMAAFANLTKA